MRLELELLEDRTLPSTDAALAASLLQTPLSFEPNAGQAPPQVQFVSQGDGYTLSLGADQAVLSLQQSAPPTTPRTAPPLATPTILQMQLVGGNSSVVGTGLDEQAGKSNYLIGNDLSQWASEVAQYENVEFQNVFSGVNVVYHGSDQQQLEYDFQIAPGADPGQIQLQFTGQQNEQIDGAGDLVLQTKGGDVIEHAPVAYQQANGVRQPVSAQYVVEPNGQVGFWLGTYDPSLSLVIDPALTYSTYLGGSGNDYAQAIAVDGAGNTYVTGETSSTNFPSLSPSQASNAGGYDAFVTKLNASGQVVFSTYLGGSNTDDAQGIAVDSTGNIYVAGYTFSSDFPTLHPSQASNNGNDDVFVTKLNGVGQLVYSTYLGGSGFDFANAIAVDGAGDAYVTGATNSTNFPTLNPIQGSNGGGYDAFITKLNTGGQIAYSTYLGGANTDYGNGIAVDNAANAYVTGYTYSTNFPTVSPLQGTNAGLADAFIAKLTSGGQLTFSTYLGGNNYTYGQGIAVDAAGNFYVAGLTDATNLSTLNAVQAANAGGYDAFVVKVNANAQLVYSTYFGGSGNDYGYGIAVDSVGNAYFTGYTVSTNFPTLNPSQGTNAGSNDAFVTKLNANGQLAYSTYLGGSIDDFAYGIGVDSAGNAYVAGYTDSTNFPTDKAAQASSAGGYDAFVTEISVLPPQGSVPKFVSGGIFATGLYPQGVVTADFNGDGIADLAAVNALSNTVSILLGNGNGTFQPQITMATGAFPQAIAVGDFGNGELDLAVVNSSSNSISVFLGNGNGTFIPGATYATGAGSYAITTGDFNVDNKLDLAVTNQTANTLSVFLGNANGTFQPAVTFGTFNEPGALVAGDFNGDHKLDLAVGNFGGNSVSVLLNNSANGNLSFQPQATFATGIEPAALATGTINGNLGLAVANFGSNSVSLLLGNGNGTFAQQQSFAVGNAPDAIAVADFNNDNKLDVAVTDIGGTTISVLLGNGDGTLAPQGTVAVGLGPEFLTVGDFNDDGRPDLAYTTNSGSGIGLLLNNYTNTGSASWMPAIPFPTGKGPKAVASGDFNGDGKLDVVVANYLSNTISIFLGNGNGTFAAPTTLATGQGPTSLAVGDLFDNGNLDIAVANAKDGTVSLFVSNGDGTFAPQFTLISGLSHPDALAFGDFDGNHRLGLAVTDSGLGELFIKEFGNPLLFAYPVGRGPESVAVGDFNGDGKLDLAVANALDNTISVLLGNGNSTFAAQSTFAAGPFPVALTTGDFNGDGNADLAVTNVVNNPNGTTAGEVSVLLGNGKGGFSTPTAYPTGSAPFSVTVGDFNGDGNLDLAVANANLFTSSISVLLGNGNGQFGGALTLLTGAKPLSITAGDFTGDGAQDLVTANYQSNNISLLLNKPHPYLKVSSNFAQTGPVVGQPGSLTANVSLAFPGVPVPTGTVTVSENGTMLVTQSLASGSSIVTLPLNFLKAGTHTLQINYSGDNYFVSAAATLSLVVSPAPTTVAITSATPSTSYAGQSVTITATVNAGGGTPTGTVTFMNGTTALSGPVALDANGRATFNLSGLPLIGNQATTYTITGVYGNTDSNFIGGSTSNALSQIIDPRPSFRHWTGKDAESANNNNWSDPNNWAELVAPDPGDDLYFPNNFNTLTDAALTANNDFTAGTAFNSLQFPDIKGGYTLTGDAVTLSQGIVVSGSNSLSGTDTIALNITLAANETFAPATASLVLMGNINLGTFTLTLAGTAAPGAAGQLVSGSSLIGGTISGSGNLVFQPTNGPASGTSNWALTASNTNFTGTTTIDPSVIGSLIVNTSTSLGTGTAAGTVVVQAGGSLQVTGGVTLAQPLTINGQGNAKSAGAVNVTDTNGTDTFKSITLTSASQIFTGAGNTTITFGTVATQGYTFSLAGNSTTTFLLNGTLTGSVTVFGGTVGGTGTVTGSVTVSNGATLSPGGAGTGQFNTGAANFGTGSTFNVNIASASAYSNLNASGSANLNGSNLNLSFLNGFKPAAGQSYVIVTAGSLTGTFNNLPNLSIFSVNGQQFQIQYVNNSAATPGHANAATSPYDIVSISYVSSQALNNAMTTTVITASQSQNLVAGTVITLNAIVNFVDPTLQAISPVGTVTFSLTGAVSPSGGPYTLQQGGNNVFSLSNVTIFYGSFTVTANFNPPNGTEQTSTGSLTPSAIQQPLTITQSGGMPGSLVTIAGTSFVNPNGGSNVLSVDFNGIPSASFHVDSNTQITTSVPLGAGTGPVNVGGTGGRLGSSTTNFIAAPTVSGFTPGIGVVGSTVTMTGTDFTGANAVSFGGVPATPTVQSPTQLSVTVPAGARTGLVNVTTGEGTGTSPAFFLVQPTISDFSPKSGPAGTTVTLAGSGFVDVGDVQLGNVILGPGSFTFVSDSKITFTVPAGVTTGPIQIGSFAGSAQTQVPFLVQPVITSVTPQSGKPGTVVTITGSGFVNAWNVQFTGATVGANAFTIVSDSKITVTVPASATTGTLGLGWAGGVSQGPIFTVTAATATFTPAPGSPLTTGIKPAALVAGDFNGDGKTDLAVVNYGNSSNASSVSVFLGNGNGTFNPGATITGVTAGPGLTSIGVGHFTTSGHADLVVGSQVLNSQNKFPLFLYFGNGNGTFNLNAKTAAIASQPQVITVGDVGTGHDTVVVGIRNSLGGANPDGEVNLYLGNGDGTFTFGQIVITGGGNLYGAAIANLGDGHPDIVVDTASGPDGHPTVWVLHGNGQGGFPTMTSYSLGSGVSNPRRLTIGDFNGDQKTDVAVAGYGSNNVAVLLGNGNGTLGTNATYATAPKPYAIAAADFNNDTDLDLVTGNQGGSLSVLYGNGNGTFQAPANLTAGGFNTSVIAPSWTTSGGLPNLAVVSFSNGGASANTVSIFNNTPAGAGSVNKSVVGGAPLGRGQAVEKNAPSLDQLDEFFAANPRLTAGLYVADA